MEKFSVKKPFTVLVAVVMVLILGFVAITKMQTNLLPDVSTPYLMVVTVYPGASPERVESEVSDVLQNALTVPGVENITATSAENYSLLLMHFTDDTDMNSALVKVSNKLDQAKSDLPSSCLTPSIIEYSLNMNAFMTVAVSREGSDIYQMSELVKDTLVPYVQRKGGVSNVSSSGLVEKLVQVQLNQDKIDEINAQLLDLIDTKLADARAQLDSAESQIAAGRAEYDRQMKNFGNTVSNTVLASMSTEVGNAVDVVRKQAQALMESVNQLIAVVKEPEIQQALIEVQQGLQKVLDKFDNTGMRDIDSLIEVVSELRDVTDKLTDALQKLQERVNTETGTEGSSAADLADELQLQQSLQVIYSTLEDTIKAMDNVPQLMSTFSGALGSFTQQQLNAYMQFTEAREQLNEYEKQLETAKQEYETARTQALAQADVQKQLDEAEPGQELRVPFQILIPEHTKASLEADLFRDRLSYAHTEHTWNSNRTRNLELACEAIDGYILKPGAVFSFNGVVGERTAEKGYREAIVYSGMESVQELGGGVCQVASTLYYCTLYADLEVVSRAVHTFSVDYVPMGMDATVYWGSLDYQFRNNTDYPIKINASVHDGYVDIEFIGTDTKDYYVEMDYVVLSKDPWETVEKVITDGSYENGETITTPYTGYTADTYKYKYSKATDELISKEFEAHSEYARRDKVVAVVRQATEPPVTDPPPTDPPETDPPTDPPTEPETPPASETEGSNE